MHIQTPQKRINTSKREQKGHDIREGKISGKRDLNHIKDLSDQGRGREKAHEKRVHRERWHQREREDNDGLPSLLPSRNIGTFRLRQAVSQETETIGRERVKAASGEERDRPRTHRNARTQERGAFRSLSLASCSSVCCGRIRESARDKPPAVRSLPSRSWERPDGDHARLFSLGEMGNSGRYGVSPRHCPR